MRLILIYLSIPINSILIFYNPFWGVMIMAVSYFIRPDIWGAPMWVQRYIYIYTIALIISWIFHKKGMKIKFSKNLVFFFLLLIAMYISSYSAVVSKQASFANNVTIIKLLILMFLVINIINSKQKINLTMWAIVAGIAWLAKSAIFEYIAYGVVRADPRGGQGAGANFIGMIIAMVMPFLYFKIFEKSNKIERIIAILLLPYLLFAFIACGSRSAFLGIITVTIFLLFKSKRKSMIIFAIMGGFLIFSVFARQTFWERMKTITEYEQDSGGGRLILWKAGIQMFKDYPLTGVGPDNFELLSVKYTSLFTEDGKGLEHIYGGGLVAHNTYIELLAEGGVQSLVLFLLVIFTTFYDLKKINSLEPDKELNILKKSIQIGLLPFLVTAIFGSIIIRDILYYYLGLASALNYIAYQDKLMDQTGEAECQAL